MKRYVSGNVCILGPPFPGPRGGNDNRLNHPRHRRTRRVDTPIMVRLEAAETELMAGPGSGMISMHAMNSQD